MNLKIEQALQKGIEAHKEGKVQDAERIYRTILQSQPLHPDANHNLGVLAFSVNKAQVALPLFKTALEANPKIEQFWLSYIDALIKEKQFNNARAVLEQAVKRGLDNEKFNSLKAQIVPISQTEYSNSASPIQQQLSTLIEHYQNGRFNDAEKLATSITQEFPTNQFAWKVLGAVLGATGKKSKALDANQTAVALSPKDAEIHKNLGATLNELGRLDEAEASYKQAIALKPDFAEAHYSLGNTLRELGRLDEVEASYKQAIALKPDYPAVHFNLGNMLHELGRLDDAEVSYTKAIAFKPEYAEAQNNLGNTLQELGRLEDAEASYKQAIDLKPDYPAAHSNLGNTLQKLGRSDESIELYNKALASQPGDAKLLLSLSAAKEKAVPFWHLPMMNEHGRNEAYKKAMNSAIRENDVVLDIGTGAGLLSMIAADCGAKEIITCEMSKTISKIARKIIQKNGFDHKIRVINKNSKDLILGQDINKKADILVSEILSSEFVGEGIQTTILDAKKRLLKKTGKMIPEGGSIMIALIENTGKLAKEIFVDNALGYDIRDFNSIISNKYIGTLGDEPVFLSDPIEAFTFDFCKFEKIYKDTQKIKIEANRAGVCAGVIQWLKVRLYDDIEYQNNPVEMYRSNSVSGWRTPIFKFNDPINVKKGQSLNIQATLNEDYSWFNLDRI